MSTWSTIVAPRAGHTVLPRPTVGGFSLWTFFLGLLVGSAMLQAMNCLVLSLAWDTTNAASAAAHLAAMTAAAITTTNPPQASPAAATVFPTAQPTTAAAAGSRSRADSPGERLSSDLVLVSATIALQFIQLCLFAVALVALYRNARRASLPSAWAVYYIAILFWGGQYLAAEIIGGDDALILTNVAVHRRAEVESAAELWLRIALYTSVSIQTLCGLGDVVPSSVWCRLLSATQMLFGVAADAAFVLVVHRWFARSAASGGRGRSSSGSSSSISDAAVGSNGRGYGGGGYGAVATNSEEGGGGGNPFARRTTSSSSSSRVRIESGPSPTDFDALTRTAFTPSRGAKGGRGGGLIPGQAGAMRVRGPSEEELRRVGGGVEAGNAGKARVGSAAADAEAAKQEGEPIEVEAEWPCLECTCVHRACSTLTSCDNALCFCSATPLFNCIGALRRALQRVLLLLSLCMFACTVLTLWWTHGKPSHAIAIVAVAGLQVTQLSTVLFSAWQYIFDPRELSVSFLAQAFLALTITFAGMYRLLWLITESSGGEIVGGGGGTPHHAHHGAHAAPPLPLPPFHIPDRRDAASSFDYAASGATVDARRRDGVITPSIAAQLRPGGRGEFLGVDGAPLPFAAVLADLLYLSVEVMTGAGFGDVLPLAAASRLLVSAQMLVSVFFSVLLAARSIPAGVLLGGGGGGGGGGDGARNAAGCGGGRRSSSPVKTAGDDRAAII